ncbi:MAG TPA: GAF domain-containing sensor histidine kinase [Candidatus Limnocylindrales bacterium]|nr:GAF domain-containing sensor histidine kinase [Candidatus Limnocylindrales bacterium]
MTARALLALRSALLVVAMAAIVVVVRLLLDALVGARGWYVIVILAVFVTARLVGTRAAVLVALLVAASRAVLPASSAPPAFGAPGSGGAVDVTLDLVAGVAAVVLSLMLRRAALRARESDRAAEASAGELVRAARREQEVRRLAREVAGPQSVRQLADRFARRALAMLDAEGVAVVSGPSGLARAAGGPSDATLGSDGSPPDPAALEPLVEESSRTGRVIRPEDGPLVVPLLAGTGPMAVALIALSPGRRPGDDELESLLLLGRIAAEAMARSELAATSRRDYDRAAAAAERIRRLQALAGALGRELDGEAIARLVVDAAAEGTGSSVGVLSRVDPDRAELELLHARGYPVGLLERERRIPLHASLPAPTVARTGRAIAVDAVGWAAEFPGASDLPAMAGLGHVVALPVGGRTPLAALVVGRPGAQAYDDDDIGFLDAVAEHAAQALRRAVLVDLLRDRDRRLGLTLGVARAGTWELDVETRRLEVSGELRRLYGLADDEPLGTLDAYLERVHSEDRELVHDAIAGAASGGGPFTVEFRVPRPGAATLRMLGVGRTFADEAGRPARLMAIDRDVSPERAAEAERERLLEQEREARRFSEAFFGVMSHELRTPVTTIIAGARLLGRTTPLEPGDIELVEDIAFEANRLHRLIDDLLVLSRVERGNLVLSAEPVHVGHLVERVVIHEQRRWPETTFALPRTSQEVIEGEETYVEQVLRNLLSNAAKYSPVGSTVEIRVERTGDEVAVRVLDQGSGVGADEVADLFSLFYRSPTTAATASGAGIGLFVCDRLIRAMGGRIWARRRPEGGSEFGFALRAIADEDGAELDAEELPDRVPGPAEVATGS